MKTMMKSGIVLVVLAMVTGVIGVSATAFGVSIDAGPDQTVSGSVALIAVTLDSTISDPNVSELFVYLWSGNFATINDNNSLTAFDPDVTFTVAGEHVLTLNVTGSEGAEVSDTVTITVETNWIGATGVGTTGGDWHTAGNWDTNAVPDPNACVHLGRETAEIEFATTIVNIDDNVDVIRIWVADDPNYVNGGVKLYHLAEQKRTTQSLYSRDRLGCQI